MKKHNQRKGVGCRYEDCIDGETVTCGLAYEKFGSYYGCVAPRDCWLDKKLIKKFIEGKHCPNCSKINKPFMLIKDTINQRHCSKCKFKQESLKASDLLG